MKRLFKYCFAFLCIISVALALVACGDKTTKAPETTTEAPAAE